MTVINKVKAGELLTGKIVNVDKNTHHYKRAGDRRAELLEKRLLIAALTALL
jgi:hypothetical protein